MITKRVGERIVELWVAYSTSFKGRYMVTVSENYLNAIEENTSTFSIHGAIIVMR